MKRLTTLAAAVLAALALSSAIGSAAASADTVLCSSKPAVFSYCPKADILPAGSNFVYWNPTNEDVFWINSVWGNTYKFHCQHGGIGGETTAESGEPLPVTVGMLFGNCQLGNGPECNSVEISNADGTLQNYLPGRVFLMVGSAAKPFVISYDCRTAGGTRVQCKFTRGSEPFLFDIKYKAEEGPVEGLASGKTLTEMESGGFCPPNSEIKMTIRTTVSIGDGDPALR